MPAALPPEIDVITTPRGERYEMPARDVGRLKIVAIPVFAIGVLFFFVGLYVTLIEGGTLGLILGNGYGKPFDGMTALTGISIFAIGVFPMYLGLFMLGGYSTIEIRGDKLIATQRSSPVRWRRKIRLDRIRKFQIWSSGMKDSQGMASAAANSLFVVLSRDRFGGILAWGYPKPMLHAVADHLSMRCQTISGAKLLDDGRPAIEVEAYAPREDWFAGELDRDPRPSNKSIPTQPADSTVILTPNDSGLTLTIPAVGIRKGSKGLLGGSMLWNGLMTVFTLGMLSTVRQKPVSEVVLIAAFFTLFWSIGIAMLIGAINAGRRRAILDVVGDTLLITRKNIFKTRQQEVARDNIKSIRRDKSGVKVNGIPILNLQVRLHEGKKISMFSQLTDEELGWLAAVLRDALDVPPRGR